MRLQSIVAAFVMLSATFVVNSARADSITFDSQNGDAFKYDFRSTMVTTFAPGQSVNFTGLAGVTGASSGFFFFTGSFTPTSATFTNDTGMYVEFSTGEIATNIFTIDSTASSGTVAYSADPNTGAFSGSIAGPSVPAAVTPEPSSLLLLGTGVLGVAGLMRRRFV